MDLHVLVLNRSHLRLDNPQSPHQPNPHPNVLRRRLRKLQSPILCWDGTPVKLRLGRTISSADAKAGDEVDFEVLEDVKVNDTVVIAKLRLFALDPRATLRGSRKC